LFLCCSIIGRFFVIVVAGADVVRQEGNDPIQLYLKCLFELRTGSCAIECGQDELVEDGFDHVIIAGRHADLCELSAKSRNEFIVFIV